VALDAAGAPAFGTTLFVEEAGGIAELCGRGLERGGSG